MLSLITDTRSPSVEILYHALSNTDSNSAFLLTHRILTVMCTVSQREKPAFCVLQMKSRTLKLFYCKLPTFQMYIALFKYL